MLTPPSRPRRLVPAALLLVLPLVLAACGGRSVPAAATATATTAAVSTTARTPGTPSIEAAPTAAPSATPGGSPAGSASATATSPRPAATATAASTPTAAATPVRAFEVTLQPPFVPQGETLLVRAEGVASATLRIGSRTIPMFTDARGAWTVVGVGLYADLGPAPLAVTGQDPEGATLGTVNARYTVVDPQRPADYLETTEETASLLTPEAAAMETQQRSEQFASFDPTPAWRTAFRHPVLGYAVTTQFGSGRSINGGPVGDFHSGEDLAVDAGVEVTSAAPGRVSWVGAMPIRGNTVIVDHGGGVKTGYHHLLDTSVTAGQPVAAGALLGHVGSTGFSTGPHLHWELTIFGVNVDPETWTRLGFPR